MAKGQKIGYIRVSSNDQNIDRQLEGLELDKKFIDRVSGKNTEREQLQLMLSYAREGDAIYVHSMDRLARNLDDLRKTVFELCKKGISVIFIKENLTFSGDNSPMSNLLLSLIGAVSEFERDIILERQREGIKLAKVRGAYKNSGRKKVLTAEQVLEMKSLVEKRIPKTEIARHFNMHRTSVYGYLHDIKLEQISTEARNLEKR